LNSSLKPSPYTPVGRQHLAAVAPVETLPVGMVMPTYVEAAVTTAMPTHAEVAVGRQHLAAVAPVETLPVGMAMPTYVEAVEPVETLPVGMVMPTYVEAAVSTAMPTHAGAAVGRQYLAAVVPPRYPTDY
jgi:hypothetical protein